MPDYDLIIIGAGIAGMTAAIGAATEGIKKILLVEKENYVGGLLNQFIHNGFGGHVLDSLVTGPEYINFIEKQLKGSGIEIILDTTVIDIEKNKKVTYVNPDVGVKEVTAHGIILAMGARETYSGNVVIPTNGLTGIFTVGEAHRIVNLEGYLPGRKTVIIAKDKWGFIVARRLLIEGGKIQGVVIDKSFEEVVDEEIQYIIDGFDIPIIQNSRVLEIEGETRIERVRIMNLINNMISKIDCDSLLLSVGFLPETSILKKLELDINNEVLGPEVKNYETSEDGFFACGNIIYGEKILNLKEIYGTECGVAAAQYIKGIS